MPLDQAMDPKACYGSCAAIEKDEVHWTATIDERKVNTDSFGPKGGTDGVYSLYRGS